MMIKDKLDSEELERPSYEEDVIRWIATLDDMESAS
jgi:hypothetical protein